MSDDDKWKPLADLWTEALADLLQDETNTRAFIEDLLEASREAGDTKATLALLRALAETKRDIEAKTRAMSLSWPSARINGKHLPIVVRA